MRRHIAAPILVEDKPTCTFAFLVAQDRREVTVYRRSNGWSPEVLRSPEDVLALPSLGFSVPLPVVYEKAGVPG